MRLLILTILISLLFVAAGPFAADEPVPATEKDRAPDLMREAYAADAGNYSFYHDAERQKPLTLVKKPIMRWANDDDWSGDVFAWTYKGRPEVLGSILSGPGSAGLRYVYHEFHLLAERPIAAADLQTRRRWEPREGLALQQLADAPEPAATASARLAQMRRLTRDFTAHMEANGIWELRLLTQPLFRYGEEGGDVVDGALFTYVWTRGTDPEVVLLLECRRGEARPAWHFAPVRFSNREVWLKHHDREVWRAAPHKEPPGNETAELYTTAFARSVPQPDAINANDDD